MARPYTSGVGVTRIHERTEGHVQVLDVEGPITHADGASLLGTRIKSLVQNGYTQLLVNVGRVPYLDSAGLGELVQAHVTISRHGGALKLVNATRRLRDLLVMTKLMSVLESFDNETAAVASFHQTQCTAIGSAFDGTASDTSAVLPTLRTHTPA
jgi:anti-sigma B factor antagonist